MKTKVTLLILAAFLLTSCEHMRHQPVKLNLENALNIQIVDGKPAVVNEKGVVVSRPVKPPIDLREGDFKVESLKSIQELSIITFKGSCKVLLKSGGEYAIFYFPDGHRLCP